MGQYYTTGCLYRGLTGLCYMLPIGSAVVGMNLVRNNLVEVPEIHLYQLLIAFVLSVVLLRLWMAVVDRIYPDVDDQE